MKTWDSVSIHDGRDDSLKSYRFDDAKAALYELCADAKCKEELLGELECDAAWLEAALQEFLDKSLMIFADDAYLSLALPQNPYY